MLRCTMEEKEVRQMSIGHLIKEQRLRNNLSQEEVAQAIGSTKQAVYKYENGIGTNITMDKIENIIIFIYLL